MVTGTNVNWAIVHDGSAVTVVDAGYPNDAGLLIESLRALGHTVADVEAIVLTHAHLDHMGGIPALRAHGAIPVLTGAEESRHARREYLEQITLLEILRQCGRAAGRRWAAQTIRASVPHQSMAIDGVTAAAPGSRLDVPGGLVAVPTPGHTSGHTSWLMPSAGVLFTGDALVTGHPLSKVGVGPQLLPAVFNEDEETMIRSLARLRELDADVIVPGHGPAARGSIGELLDA